MESDCRPIYRDAHVDFAPLKLPAMRILPRLCASMLSCCACWFVVTTITFAQDGASSSLTVSDTETLVVEQENANSGEIVTSAKESEPPVSASQILFIVDPDCAACDELLKELESEFRPMRVSGWKIDRGTGAHIRIINKADAVVLLNLSEQEAKDMQLPKVLATRKNDVVRYFKSGCSTPLDRWTFDWLFTGVDRRPAPPPIEAVTVATTGNYPLRGGHWSVEGDWHPSREKVLAHLRGPNHQSQLKPEWNLEIWSREELRSLHDNLHELETFGRTNVYSSNVNAANYVVSQAN